MKSIDNWQLAMDNMQLTNYPYQYQLACNRARSNSCSLAYCLLLIVYWFIISISFTLTGNHTIISPLPLLAQA